MVGKYKVVTLCGSTRFKDAFMETQKRLTLEGNIVISVGLFGHSGDEEVWTEGTKEMLDDMHKRKIDMADEIYVINVGGYIGSSTRSEIEYATAKGMPVRYLEEPETCYIPDVDIEESLKRLKKGEKRIRLYTEIMSLRDDPENPVFQRKYDAFYRVRRNDRWREEYFRLMGHYQERGYPCFGEILLRLFQMSNRIEASFASKMLATLDDNMPIWDTNVMTALQLRLTGKTQEIKMSMAVVIYDRICDWYQAFLKTEEAKTMLHRFDEAFPEFRGISNTKKIDFILWQSR